MPNATLLLFLHTHRFGGGFGGRDYRYNNNAGYFQKNSNFSKMGSRPMNGSGGYGQSSYYQPAQQNGYPADRNQYAQNGGPQAGGYANGNAGYQQQVNGYGQRPTDWWSGN